MVLTYLEIAAGTLVLLPVSYFLLLTLIALFPHRRGRTPRTPTTSFAVVIPAHNEAAVIGKLLSSLAGLDYPRSKVAVHVIADNCSDGTAEICRAAGVCVHERSNQTEIGKGHALRWGLGEIVPESNASGAFLFVDADCVLSANVLREMDSEFDRGAGAVQCHYAISNPAASTPAALRFLAMALKHYVRPLGRKRLGLSCGLFGTGMAVDAALIRAHGWNSFGLAEDIEAYMDLVGKGVKVAFSPGGQVLTDAPTTLGQARTQNLRWEAGRLSVAYRRGPIFLARGILRHDVRMIDAAVEQLVPPVSIVAVILPALTVLSALSGLRVLALLSGAATAVFAVEVGLGLVAARVPLSTLRSLVHVPGFIYWKLRIYLVAATGRVGRWRATERS